MKHGLTVSTIYLTGYCPSIPRSELFLVLLKGDVRVWGLLVFSAGDSSAGPLSYLPSDTERSTTPSPLPTTLLL